ncbi:dihydrolipoamide acetyltransferase family protein [Ramlibacter alkalitolerans]|uniref:Dihydrolipoamide acetyltransferase component of pyruvate dehydrogenase complex n=1 Tax=Ramlibacter alkalitolerans TaxID=2039631 RepID=A0ABS1JRJ9_9BURK|nr:dihydrolipoamide acetyltransferase family protein [Ramlibacter alkalitolerans]MBL0426776.1 2-oxo acid dehydrogenase subunit E2 [Ramlibacter alkalitolerans]
MGLYAIKMPDIGEGIAEVELVAWRVQPGDTVKEDQILADVMTDKATVEIPSPVAGKVETLGGQPGQLMAVGAELIRLEVEGAGNVREGAAAGSLRGRVGVGAGAGAAPVAPDRKDDITHENADVDAPAAGSAPTPALPQRGREESLGRREPPRATPAPMRPPGEKPIASPAVRRRAWDLGIELQFVHGSGPAGRIIHEDLDVYLAARGQGPTARATALRQRQGEEAIPVIGLRRKIAQKMQEAKRRIPHFSYVEEVDVTDLEALRAQLNAKFGDTRGKLTVLPFIARAVVLALDDFPQVNARFDDDAGVIARSNPVHLGIATQTDAGLAVPVLRHAEAQDVWGLSREIARLAHATRSGKATREELAGSTLTITSLGPLGGIVTTPVINHPEVAIVGVNRIVERPVIRNGAVVARQLMNLSSSFDHRVIDGMDAARFIQAVRALLESPAMLFVE